MSASESDQFLADKRRIGVTICSTPRKSHLSASVDDDLLEAAHDAVAEGSASSLSAWVNDAMRLKVDREALMAALDAFIGAYEERQGAITDDEIAEAMRQTSARAMQLRTPKKARRTTRTRRGQGAA